MYYCIYYSTTAELLQVIFVDSFPLLEEMLIFYIECRRICRIKIGQTDKNEKTGRK